ncbi:MAG: hypothetical protein ABI879_03075 [Actinomycetota bacterium]
MSGPALVWLVVGLVSGIAMAAVLIALIRHVFVLGRALARFQDEVTPIASSIANEGARAGARSRSSSAGSRGRPRGRP